MKHTRILPLPGTEDDGCPQFVILNSKDAWEATSWISWDEARNKSAFYVDDDTLRDAPAWIRAAGGMEDE